MTYNELWDDLAIWAPANGQNADPAHFIELQAQLRKVFKARTQSFGLHRQDNGSSGFSYYQASTPDYWVDVDVAGTASTAWFTLDGLRTGWEITDIAYQVYAGDVAQTAPGSIALQRRLINTVNPGSNLFATVQEVGGATPWTRNAVKVGTVAAMTPHVIDGTYEYRMFFQTPTFGSACECRIYPASYLTMRMAGS